ncbi:Lectin-domain containing receptor kinase, partial [Musa troglodytarum]
ATEGFRDQQLLGFGGFGKVYKGTLPGSRVLSWPQRFRILRGVASALLYLHVEWEHVVIHRDVKASNGLLDAEFNPRLGDFGLAKLHDHGANPSTTRAVGTLGYLAPELTRTSKATASSDVYSFGALVLEVVCGRRPVEPKALPEELVLVDWLWERWTAGRWADVVDHRLGEDYDREEAVVGYKSGALVLPVAWPRTREVVRYLDGGDVTEVPPLPSPSTEYDDSEGNDGFDDFVHL